MTFADEKDHHLQALFYQTSIRHPQKAVRQLLCLHRL